MGNDSNNHFPFFYSIFIKKEMDKTVKIIGTNLLILLIYFALIKYFGSGGWGFLMPYGTILFFHVLINIFTGLGDLGEEDIEIKKNGRAKILSGFLVLVIGFSTCGGVG